MDGHIEFDALMRNWSRIIVWFQQKQLIVSLHSLLTINLLDPRRRWFVVQSWTVPLVRFNGLQIYFKCLSDASFHWFCVACHRAPTSVLMSTSVLSLDESRSLRFCHSEPLLHPRHPFWVFADPASARHPDTSLTSSPSKKYYSSFIFSHSSKSSLLIHSTIVA